MFHFIRPKTSALTPGQSIVRWFLMSFLSILILFIISLLPLLTYCQNVFEELELKKSTQQMDFGISQLENTVPAFQVLHRH